MLSHATRAPLSLLLVVGLLLCSTLHAEATPPSATFLGSGKPSTLRIGDDDNNFVAQDDPGLGLYLSTRDRDPVRFDTIEAQGATLVASIGGKLPRVTFALRSEDRYLSMRIVRIEGIPASREFSLHFQLNLSAPLKAMPLDYMTEVWANWGPGRGRVQADWKHLWNRHPSNPLGGFALYLPGDDATEDDTILQIWVNEQLPHPATKGTWTLEAARAWVQEWLAQHSDQSRFWVAARTPEELYEIVPYVEKSGARDVYLFTETWRGGETEPFFPVRKPNWSVNTKVFPKGEDDLRAYSDHLAKLGIKLKLHWVSGGIGFADPVYVGNAPDSRLASWGSGTLATAVQAGEKSLEFRPDPGTVVPLRVAQAGWESHYDSLPVLHPWFEYNMLNLGGELIQVGAFEDTDKPVWRLLDCKRGMGSTTASAHAAGASVRGLISAYNVNFIPENDSTLLDEMAAHYAGLLNRCRIANVEYDGAEIHAYNGRMWGFQKFASLLYQKLDHPVTAYTSSGNAPACHIEYLLHATRHTTRERQKGIVGIALDRPYRPASNLLDAHWGLSQMCAHAHSIVNIMKPDPLFGIDLKSLKSHGQVDEILRLARSWKRVNQVIAPDLRAQIRQSLYLSEDRLQQAGTHEKSEILHVLEAAAGAWNIYPTRVLRREGNLDTVWHDGQEHGAISPGQYLKLSESIDLINVLPEQTPRFVLQVLPAFEQTPVRVQANHGQGQDEKRADQNFDYLRMLQNALTGGDSQDNTALQPKAAELRNTRETRFEDDGEVLVMRAENPTGSPIVNEDNLPEWSRTLNMTRRRGIGMWVQGDGSGAVLTVQIPGGDYVVPIDFTDRRYIEIPDAQVAWSTGYWGWRMGNKRPYYEGVNWLKMGFGYLPPKTSATVRIEALCALREIPATVENLQIQLGTGLLRLEGAVSTGQYVTWDGAGQARLFDANWTLLKELPVHAENFSAPQGKVTCRIQGVTNDPSPWFRLQLMTRDKPIVVPDDPLGTTGG